MNKMKLIDYIGQPALFEQTAEECMELGFACLKIARYLRGENEVHNRTEEDLIQSLHEEIADLDICIDELNKGGMLDIPELCDWIDKKRARMRERLEIGGKKDEKN